MPFKRGRRTWRTFSSLLLAVLQPACALKNIALANAEDLADWRANSENLGPRVCVRECGGNVPKTRDGIGIASEELVNLLSQSSAPCVAVGAPRAARFASVAPNTAAHSIKQRRAPVSLATPGRVFENWSERRWCAALDRVHRRWRAAESQINQGFKIAVLNRRKQRACDYHRTILNHIRRCADRKAPLARSRRRSFVLSSGTFCFRRPRSRLAVQ
jgi:hypothetical protein